MKICPGGPDGLQPEPLRSSGGRASAGASSDAASWAAAWAALGPARTDFDGVAAAPVQAPAPAVPVWQGSVPAIPLWQGSMQACLERAQIGLRQALSQLGIPLDTAFTIDTGAPDGRVEVLGDFEGREELQALIHARRDLHESLRMASSNAAFCRVVQVAQRGAAAAQADPAHAQAYNAWTVQASQQVQAEPVFLRFLSGRLTARVLGQDGSHPALEGLPRPPRLG